MDLDELLRAEPKIHRDESGHPYSWQLSNDVLRFIDAHVREGSKTLETGAGVSTVLFALKGASHVCIVPFQEEVASIKAFCRDQIAHYKVPRYVKFVDEFPMTVTGKIQKYIMRERMIAELGLKVAKTA